MENAILANQGQKWCHVVLSTCMNPNILYVGIEHAGVFVVGSQALHGSERAHLRFAHAETLIPLTCLLGLFLNVEGAGSYFTCLCV